MAAVTIHSAFRAQEEEICHSLHIFPLLFAMKWWNQMQQSSFSNNMRFAWMNNQKWPTI